MTSRTPMIASGDLRHRVLHQTNQPTTNATNEDVDHWVDGNTYWALVEDLSGRELFYAQQVDQQVDHRVTLRYLPSMPVITDQDRFLWKNKILNITGIVNPGNRNVMLECLCTEDPNQDPPVS